MQTVEARIRELMYSMPYGGGIMQRDPVTLESVADYLEALRAKLRSAAENNNTLQSKVYELQADRDATRRYLGIAAKREGN
jgi:hypothetical protein